jgi:CopG family nickel-responsive transcriptional regulator
MERITISLDAELAAEFDRLIAERGYRTAPRPCATCCGRIWNRRAASAARPAIASPACPMSINHHERDLAERLTALQHGQHDLTVATLHAHLDHENCLESVILRGPTAAVRSFSDALIAERGVRHGQLNLIDVVVDSGREHHHGYVPAGRSHGHVHLKPKT